MNRIYTFIFIATLMMISACSQKSIMNSTSKETYTGYLKGMSGKQLEQQLAKDAASLNSVLDSLKGFQFYYMIGFGASGSSGVSATIDSAEAFIMPQKDSIFTDFNHPERKLYFEQTIALPESVFEFSTGYSQEAFRNIGVPDLKIDMQKIYSKGQEVSPEHLKLARADSVQVKTAYHYPLQFDTLVIDLEKIRKTKKADVAYGSYTIKLDRVYKNETEFSVPIELSGKVLDYRGITQDGVPIKSNSYSKFPITGIDAEIEKNVRSLSEALASKDKEKVFQQLEESPDEVLHYIQQLIGLEKDYFSYNQTEYEDDLAVIDQMKVWMKKYQDILNVNNMQYDISFPHEVKQIHLYIATAYDSISKEFMAVNVYEGAPKYSIYLDKSNNKYGIINQDEEIIIPAEYENLTAKSNLFFTERIKGDFFTYQLDTEHKKLNKIPGNVTFFEALNDDFFVFHNEERYTGVLDKNLNEILPFRFDQATLCGDVFVMTVNHRGRQYKEFYTKGGKQIDISEKITKTSCGERYIILTDRNGKSGVIDKKGKLTVPLKYYISAYYRISDQLVVYQAENKNDAELGIINAESGKIIVPAENGFDYIGDFSEGLAHADFMPGYQYQMGYINEKGETVIPAQFLSATPFYKGLACVKAPDNKIHLINKKVQIVKTFPDRKQSTNYKSENYGVQREWEEMVYYKINDIYYDYQGNPLSQEIINQIENN